MRIVKILTISQVFLSSLLIARENPAAVLKPVPCLQAKIVYCVHSGVSERSELTHNALYSSRHIVCNTV